MNIQLILLVSLSLVSIASSMVIMKPRPDENDDLLKKSVAVEEDARVPENSEEADDAEPEEDLTNKRLVHNEGFLFGKRRRRLHNDPNKLEEDLTNKKVVHNEGFLMGKRRRRLHNDPNKLEEDLTNKKVVHNEGFLFGKRRRRLHNDPNKLEEGIPNGINLNM